jgi:tryptophan synthase alpha chain
VPEPRSFFPRATADRPGLAFFLNAGDPPLDALPDLVAALDEAGVDCLELAVPFPDSVTDGPVVRRSANRALAAGTGLKDVLDAIAALRGARHGLRIALLADWAHTVRPLGHDDFARRVADCGADAVLVHGLPPRTRQDHLRAAAAIRLPVVTTCYAGSDSAVRQRAAAEATAYLYLVAVRGRSGSRPAGGYATLTPVVAELKKTSAAPVAVGFGVRSRADVSALARTGADAVIVGSAVVTAVEEALDAGRDPVAALAGYAAQLHRQGPLEQEDSP